MATLNALAGGGSRLQFVQTATFVDRYNEVCLYRFQVNLPDKPTKSTFMLISQMRITEAQSERDRPDGHS